MRIPVLVQAGVLPVVLLASFAALADPLDAPAAPAHPTIRTELKRGSDVAFSCDLDTGTNALAKGECIEHSERIQAQQGTGTDAFFLGLYFTAAIDAEVLYQVLNQAGRPTEQIKSSCSIYVAGINEREKALKLTDQDVAPVTGMKVDKALESIGEARQNCAG